MSTNDNETETTRDGNPAAIDSSVSDSEDAADESSAPDRAKTRKRHGKGFVYLGLKDCDEALRKIDSHAKTMSIEQFASALGHKQPKGRFLHKIDALKVFGLIQPDTSESVTLTQLAEDMLYGAAKDRARTTAFLNYADFKKLFVDFPKGHDNSRTDIVDFIKAKLGIVNEVERFLRLFVESAEYAGLLDGKADTDAKVIRLRAAPRSMNGAAPKMSTDSPVEEYSVMSAEEVDDLLDATGLNEYKQRAEVRQRTTGKFSLTVADGGKITIEINRPIQITVNPENLIIDLPKILEALDQKGLRA